MIGLKVQGCRDLLIGKLRKVLESHHFGLLRREGVDLFFKGVSRVLLTGERRRIVEFVFVFEPGRVFEGVVTGTALLGVVVQQVVSHDLEHPSTKGSSLKTIAGESFQDFDEDLTG